MTKSGNPSRVISQEVILYDGHGNEIVNGHGVLKTVPTVRLVGKTFAGSVKDTRFWTEAVTGTGSVAVNGEASLKTGETADSTVSYVSNRRARKVSGTHNIFRCLARLVTDPEVGNLRRVGAYDDDNGYFMEINGLTFSVGYSNPDDGDVLVSSGSFNGHFGESVELDSSVFRLTIDYHHAEVSFYLNHVLLHTIDCETCVLVHTGNLPLTMENVNSGGLDTDHELIIREASISRLGEFETSPTFAHISGDAATWVLKLGAGILHRVIYNNTFGTSLTMYDDTEAVNDIIGIITTTQVAIGVWDYEVPFNNGLTIKTIGNSLDATIVYE